MRLAGLFVSISCLLQLRVVKFPLAHSFKGSNGISCNSFDEVSALQVSASVSSPRTRTVLPPTSDTQKDILIDKEEKQLAEETAQLWDQVDLHPKMPHAMQLQATNTLEQINGRLIPLPHDLISHTAHGISTEDTVLDALIQEEEDLYGSQDDVMLSQHPTLAVTTTMMPQTRTVDKTSVMFWAAIPLLNSFGIPRFIMGDTVTGSLELVLCILAVVTVIGIGVALVIKGIFPSYMKWCFIGLIACPFIWGMIEAACIAINGFNLSSSINTLGMRATFTKGTVKNAVRIANFILIEMIAIVGYLGYYLITKLSDYMFPPQEDTAKEETSTGQSIHRPTEETNTEASIPHVERRDGRLATGNTGVVDAPLSTPATPAGRTEVHLSPFLLNENHRHDSSSIPQATPAVT